MPKDNIEVKSKTKKRSFFSRTKSYLFEYTGLQIFSVSLAIVTFVAIYSIFSVIAGSNVSKDLTESLAWVFGFLVVLAPITIVLYARTSAEEQHVPARLNQTLRKVIYFMALGISLASAVVFAIVAGYSATRVLFGLESTNKLVSISAPSAVIVLLHIYYLTSVLRQVSVTAKLRRFNIVFKVLFTVVLACLVLGIATVNKGEVSEDRRAVSDLLSIAKAVDTQYRNSGSLPDNAADIKNINQDIKDKFSSQTYVYKPVLSNGYDEPVEQPAIDLDSGVRSSNPQPDIAIGRLSAGYQLCATFRTSTNGSVNENKASSEGYYLDLYSRSIRSHDSGYQCFDLYAY